MREVRLGAIVALAAALATGACEEKKGGEGEEHTCYTPCRTGAVIDGAYAPCSPDGLMEGCVGGATCVDGSCVAEGGEVPTCASDLDCPEFQACDGGRCYSNCDYDSDCDPDEGCRLHVCRMACTSRTESCPEDTYCSTLDGENGFCMPVSPAEDGQPPVEGSFGLDKSAVLFTRIEDGQTLTITNGAPLALEFTVRKVQHVEFVGDGIVVDTETPLYWLEMGPTGSTTAAAEFTLTVEGGGGQASFDLVGATNDDLPMWNGVIEVSSPVLGSQRIDLVYASSPEGQWSGKIYYFGNFGTQGLEAWIAAKDDPAALEALHNAFVQKWGALRAGSITLDNFMAVLASTRSESWRWSTMSPPSCPKAACYPFDNGVGYGEYSDNLDSNPIPTGLVELPFAMNLRVDPDGSGSRFLEGKISTTDALQYAGDPEIRITLRSDPLSCDPTVTSACLDFVDEMHADVVVGGRYLPADGTVGCTLPDFEIVRIPWLVPGFEKGTESDSETGQLYRSECRDTLQPFASAGMADVNLTYSGSNPLPDGRSRTRSIELVDGALVNQKQLVVIFKETFYESYSFVAPEDQDDFTAYGVMVLERNPTTLEDGAYVGSVQTEERAMPDGMLSVGCSEDVVMRALGSTYVASWESNPTLMSTLAEALIDGVNPGAGAEVPILPGDDEKVHYLCHDTGLFDSGSTGMSTECPLGSHVTFFTIDGTRMTQSDIDNLPCQWDGTCQDTLDMWAGDPAHASMSLRLNPFWRCTASGAVYCEDNRWDLRDGKTFFAASSTATVFIPLLTEVNDAFRYKTAFTNRSGTNVGFAPDVCVPDSNVVPYCYDPGDIEGVEERIDCVIHLYTDHRSVLTTDARNLLRDYLAIDFSVHGTTAQRDGFEALLAELLVMMGDESYTSAFASRFDLAGTMTASFEGSLFEPDGINLSGVAGHEMYSLYQAVQYYQMTLDRFYMMMPYAWDSLESPTVENFIKQETVTNYFDRLIRASTQKSRAWSEVAKRYQNFNRPDLARLVVERAYTSAYLESVLITRLMHKVVDVVNPEDKAQILYIIEQSQRQYKAALLDMRDVYKGITDDVNFFGFAPEYIPFPALDADDTNAFEKLLASAWELTLFAGDKEVIALEDRRAYETDKASFQAELVTIRNTYENQLAELCGTFTTSDGHVYPAVSKYAYLDEKAQFLGDPCGFMGNGAIHEAMASLEIANLELESQMKKRDDKQAEIGIEVQRVGDYCGEMVEMSDYVWEYYDDQVTLQQIVDGANAAAATMERRISQAQAIAGLMKCTVGTSSDCPSAALASAFLEVAFWGYEIGIDISTIVAKQAEYEAMRNERDKARFELDQECDIALIDSNAVVAKLSLEHEELMIDVLKAYYGLQLSFSVVEKLRNEAKRAEVEQQEVEELAINVEAARNDPNVRIYKNDAIINADRAFTTALKEAYKATRVFEYYTSQSYEGLDKLFLIRMVAAGDYNLENYLIELSSAFFAFEEEFGNPDVRVAVVSLRDDILNIPWLADGGEALSEDERLDLFHAKLADPALLDEDGYFTIPFSTTLDSLSPLTVNHKIYYIEAEYVGSDVGDTVGRIYLVQRGTGKVRSVAGEEIFYSFPERTAVLNTFFNGERWNVFSDDDVFRSERLRDRPFANTLWELVINQRDEEANKDINLQSLTDVRLFVYYTDFTDM